MEPSVVENIAALQKDVEYIREGIDEIKAGNLRQWDRIEHNSLRISRLKGWLAGVGVAVTVVGVVVKIWR